MIQHYSNKAKKQTVINNNVLETIRDLGSGVGKAVTQDVMGKIGADALASVTGRIPSSGELKANEPLEFSTEKQTTPAVRPRTEISHPVFRQEDMRIKEQIEAVRSELKALAASVTNLHQEVTRTITEMPVDPGVYHVNFFEQLKSFLLALRERVDDSRNWLSTFNARRKKIGYWGMYKKHGTQFGLSSERTTATQAG